jgi:hypothetical protein
MTALILTTIAIAILSAWYDKVRIAGGHEILHVPRWLIRAALVTIAALLFGHPWMVLGLWGLFSAVFRFALNRWRGKDWRYVSPSNWYDTAFIVFSISVGQLDIPRRDRFTLKERCFIMSEHALLMKASKVHWIDRTDGPDLNILPSWYAQQVHRAGTIAYIVEVVAFVVVAYICG